jgi:hypothetical protein
MGREGALLGIKQQDGETTGWERVRGSRMLLIAAAQRRYFENTRQRLKIRVSGGQFPHCLNHIVRYVRSRECYRRRWF